MNKYHTYCILTMSYCAQAEVREYLFKILVVGDLGTGKTSIIRRYVHNIFSSNYKSTVNKESHLTGRVEN